MKPIVSPPRLPLRRLPEGNAAVTLQSMPDWLGRRAETVPNRPALVTRDGTLTFAQLHERVNERARWLLGFGVEPGARVALLAANGQPFVELVHAAGRAGVILVPLNTRLTPSELAWQLQHVGARLLVFDEIGRASCRERG